MDYENMPFGIKLSAFFALIVALTYAVAAIAPESGEDPRVTIEYASLSF